MNCLHLHDKLKEGVQFHSLQQYYWSSGEILFKVNEKHTELMFSDCVGLL